MSLPRMNKTEIAKMNELLALLKLPDISEGATVEDILSKVNSLVQNSNSQIEDTEKRDYFAHLDNPKNSEKRKAIIEKLGAEKLTRVELLEKALEESNKSQTEFLNEAVDAYAVTLLSASVASGRGVLGGADERIQTAHDKIYEELKAGIYTPRADVKGEIPVSKLMTEARTSKVTVENWIKRNGLEKVYGL